MGKERKKTGDGQHMMVICDFNCMSQIVLKDVLRKSDVKFYVGIHVLWNANVQITPCVLSHSYSYDSMYFSSTQRLWITCSRKAPRGAPVWLSC